jgi:hypothetical protein
MALIDDFFLNEDRIRKVLSGKIEGELYIDFAARQALETLTAQTVAEAAIRAWMVAYSVMPRAKNLTKPIIDDLIRAIISYAPQMTRSITAASIRARHAQICTHCNTVNGIKIKDKDGVETDRDFTSLASKLLWLLHPDVVPIFDSQSWCATKVIARLSGKIETPGLLVNGRRGFVLDHYCAFLRLHDMCFSHLYATIDAFVAREFSAIFSGAKRQDASISEANARNQYGNHMTVIDQLLWHLGSDIAVEGCVTKKDRKRRQENQRDPLSPPT